MREKNSSAQRRRFRLLFVSLLIRLNRLRERIFKTSSSTIGSLILILLNPEELEQQVKRYYTTAGGFEDESRPELLEEGFSQEESHFVTTYLNGKETCLVFGSGGGRESLALARLEFRVTGLDSSPPLVEKAKERARALSLPCDFQVRDMLEGPRASEKYDVLFLSQNMYSTIPTRTRRIHFLRNARMFLNDAGFFYLEFLGENGPRKNRWKFRLKKWLALLCHGNTDLEEGDALWIPGHYFHLFTESELRSEVEASGFDLIEADYNRAYAILARNTK